MHLAGAPLRCFPKDLANHRPWLNVRLAFLRCRNTRKGGRCEPGPAIREPYRLLRPQRQRVPFVFASPHSGRCYPDSLAAASRLDPLMLRRSEDAFVDELFHGNRAGGAAACGAISPRFSGRQSRCREIDAAMFAGPLEVAIDMPGPRVTAGLGLFPHRARRR